MNATVKEILAALHIVGFPAAAKTVVEEAAAMDEQAKAEGVATRTAPTAEDEAAKVAAAEKALSDKIDAAVTAKFEALSLKVTDIAAKTAAIEVQANAATASVARAGETLTQIKGMVVKAIGANESPVKSEPMSDEHKAAAAASKKAEEDAKGGVGKINRSESGAVIYQRG